MPVHSCGRIWSARKSALTHRIANMLPTLLALTPLLGFTSFVGPAYRTGQHARAAHEHQRPARMVAHAIRRTDSSDASAQLLMDMERMRAAAALLPAMELIDTQNENARLRLDQHMLRRENVQLQRQLQSEQAALVRKEELQQLRRENDRLATELRRSTSEYSGMTVSHSLALCFAHARTAAMAALRDIRFLGIWIAHEFQDLKVHLSLKCLVWQVRIGLRVKKFLAQFQSSSTAKAADADPFKPKQ